MGHNQGLLVRVVVVQVGDDLHRHVGFTGTRGPHHLMEGEGRGGGEGRNEKRKLKQEYGLKKIEMNRGVHIDLRDK